MFVGRQVPGTIMFAFSLRPFSPLYLPYELGSTYDPARPQCCTVYFLLTFFR